MGRRTLLALATATLAVSILVPGTGHAAGVKGCARPGSPPLRGVTTYIAWEGSSIVSCSYTSFGGSIGWIGSGGPSCTVATAAGNGNCALPAGAIIGVPNGSTVTVTISSACAGATCGAVGLVGVGDQNYS